MESPFRTTPLYSLPALGGIRSVTQSVETVQDHMLMERAKALEASFLSEMLGHAGLGDAPESFDGGIGEEQFSSFLRAEQAKAMVEKGGIGLAQHIFQSLQQREPDAH